MAAIAKTLIPRNLQEPEPLQPVMLPESGPQPLPPMPQPEAVMPPIKMPEAPMQPFPQQARPKVVEPSPLDRQIQHDQQKLQKIQFQQDNPWGSANNHPGIGGKIAHVLSVAGNIAGDIFAPGVMARIPGTQLNRQMEEGDTSERLAKEQEQQSQQHYRGVEEQNVESQIKDREQPKYSPLPTDEGYQNYDPRTGAVQPLNDASGSPLMPHDPYKAASRVTLQGPDGKPMMGFVDPLTRQVSDAQGNVIPNPVPFQKAGTPPHITAMVGGKPHIMERDPASGQYSIDRGEAPPNYAMMGGTFRLAPAMLDTMNGNSPVSMNVDQLNEANATQPGRFIPAGVSAPALGKTALIEDIRGNISHLREVLQNPNLPAFSPDQRAKIALTMGRGDKGAIDAMVTGEFMGSLTPEQQDYVIGLSQLVENSMAMRSVLGAGQGSEDMRDAIRRTIPTAANPNPQYSLKQLEQFENVLNRLERGIINVPLRGQGGGNQPAGGAGNDPLGIR